MGGYSFRYSNRGDISVIDYEKLKEAHEMAAESGIYFFKVIYGAGNKVGNVIEIFKFDENYDTERCNTFISIDDLISELTELTKAKSKYKVGDEVWYLDLPINEIYLSQVLKVRDREYVVDGDTNGTKSDFIESELYPTKEALIAAQAAYWSAMQEPYKPEFEGEIKGFSECQHEPNGQTSLIGYPEAYKCKKCGVYYR